MQRTRRNYFIISQRRKFNIWFTIGCVSEKEPFSENKSQHYAQRWLYVACVKNSALVLATAFTFTTYGRATVVDSLVKMTASNCHPRIFKINFR